ncbi:hypothetical protein LINPERPRIM_LOCUS35313 [Linum perenne]
MMLTQNSLSSSFRSEELSTTCPGKPNFRFRSNFFIASFPQKKHIKVFPSFLNDYSCFLGMFLDPTSSLQVFLRKMYKSFPSSLLPKKAHFNGHLRENHTSAVNNHQLVGMKNTSTSCSTTASMDLACHYGVQVVIRTSKTTANPNQDFYGCRIGVQRWDEDETSLNGVAQSP